ncbi:transient receptor potential cation channel subfamily V member 2-like isoform X2 [Xenia sp. Carnegie-2017]|nr:transient receptor potential cation channel subfamily V member 2-like isoform X2 [Xenia sp. Carnegie-2017]
MASLEYLISRFTEIILEDDHAQNFCDESDDAQKTLLHYAAKQNFVHVAKHLVKKYPKRVYQTTKAVVGKGEFLPVEMALEEKQDETSAFLISQMTPDRIYELFLYDDLIEGAKFDLRMLISQSNMKKTVVAVLNTLINPHWPYLPQLPPNEEKAKQETKDLIERVCSYVPDDPLNYDFFYHVLECDKSGVLPNSETFDKKSETCLLHLTASDNKEAIQHPVIRMFVKKKWKNFAHRIFCIQAICYSIFLVVLSYALIYGATREHPNHYNGPWDSLRLFCEILSIIFLMIYVLEEFYQIYREFKSYYKDPYNYFDWIGIILTLLVIPLRYVDVSAQWSFASIGYLFNFLRIFKFSCVTRTTGVYTKTLAKIVYRDISRFIVVFIIVFIGFCGSFFMALTAAHMQDLFTDYGQLMLAAVRVLTEQQPIKENYGKFNWFIILILLCYMAMVIVILLNILIAQLSFTYSEAKNRAKLQYAIDRMAIISRLERGIFGNYFRLKYYLEGDKVNENDLVKEMLEYNDEQQSLESTDEKLTYVRDLMKKVFRKISNESS